jgi:hypothetical protein
MCRNFDGFFNFTASAVSFINLTGPAVHSCTDIVFMLVRPTSTEICFVSSAIFPVFFRAIDNFPAWYQG